MHMRLFTVTFLGPTNHKGSRVKIKDNCFNKTVIISKSYSYNSILDQAIDILKEKGINVEATAETDKSYVLLSSDFTNQIK